MTLNKKLEPNKIVIVKKNFLKKTVLEQMLAFFKNIVDSLNQRLFLGNKILFEEENCQPHRLSQNLTVYLSMDL